MSNRWMRLPTQDVPGVTVADEKALREGGFFPVVRWVHKRGSIAIPASSALAIVRAEAKKKDKDGEEPTTVETLIFSKKVFKTAAKAKKWAKDHDYKATKVDETDKSWRIRQRDPGDFKKDSFRTITFTKGVKAVVGHLK
jgi:hypothetical protein